jgi:hypothetical protein
MGQMEMKCIFAIGFFLAGLHKVHPAYRMVNAGWASVRAGGRASLIGYLLCVINSSHTF